MADYKLQTIEIQKEYPGTIALQKVSIGFESGKVHSLIGKNGAGKSTLVKILSGAIQPTSGKILLDGKEIQLFSPRNSFRQGIATVYQELSLIPELTVAENVLFGRLPTKTGFGNVFIDWAKIYHRAERILENIHVQLDVRKKVKQLGVAQQQLVEIAKIMSFQPSVIILDEPTSALAYHETQNLFDLIKKLTIQGVSIIYISHRLQELQNIAHTVSVLRDGLLINTIPIEKATPDTIVRMMFGDVIQKIQTKQSVISSETILEIKNLNSKDKLFNIYLNLHKGEILGIGGMLGSGRTELLRAIAGVDPFDAGEIIIQGQPIYYKSPAESKRLGFGFTPENRKEQGLVQMLSARDNLCLAGLDKISRHGWIRKKRQNDIVQRLIRGLNIMVSSPEQPVYTLSGGNQQKVVIGNWLNTNPKIMLFDEPTRGIDIQAKQQVFQIMQDLSQKGISSIFVSSELEELFEVCHRILIMQKGRIAGEIRPENSSLESLYKLCMEEKILCP